MKGFSVPIAVFLLALTACQGPGEDGDSSQPEERYVSFSQSVRGLITGMTSINGNLVLKPEHSFTTTTITLSDGAFSISRQHQLKAGTYALTMTTDEGLLLKVERAQLGKSSLTYPVSNRPIDNVIEKEEAMRNYLARADQAHLSDIQRMAKEWPDYCLTELLPAKRCALERLEELLRQSHSDEDTQKLNEIRAGISEDISRIQAGEMSLQDAYFNATSGGSNIWLKPPVVAIYDRSVWHWENDLWSRKPELDRQVVCHHLLAGAENYFASSAWQYFDGLTQEPFTLLKESAGDQMPDPNAEVTSANDTRYIFVMINDHPTNYNVMGGFTAHVDTSGHEVTKSFASAPLVHLCDDWWGNMSSMLFVSTSVSTGSNPGFSALDENGNPSALIKLVGKIQNHRDPGHCLSEENGAYTDRQY